MHCLPSSLVLPFPIEAIYQHLGNCITPHHAVLALANLHKFVHPEDDLPTVAQSVHHMEERRLRASDHLAIRDDLAIYIGPREVAEKQHQAFQLLMTAFEWHGTYQPTFPDDTFFHPQKGRCTFTNMAPDPDMQIPRTFPFTSEQIEMQQQQITQEELNHFDDQLQDHEDQPTKIDTPDVSEETSSNAEAELDAIMHSTSDRYVNIRIQTKHRETINIMVHETVEWGALLSLWEFRLQPDVGPTNMINQTSNSFFMHDKVHECCLISDQIAETELIPSPYEEKIILVANMHTSTYIVAADRDTKWEDIQTSHPEISSCCYDASGFIPPQEILRHNVRLTMEPIPLERTVCIAGFQIAIRTISYTVQHTDQALVLEFTGSTDHLAAVIMLWHLAFNTDWQKAHGLIMTFRTLDENTCQILFRPQQNAFDTPICMIRDILHIRLFQTAIQTLADEPPTKELRFKLDQRYFASVAVAESLSFGQVHAIIAHCFHAQQPNSAPRMICFGKRLEHLLQVCDIRKPAGYQKNHYNIHFVYPLRGGGPSEGNKKEHAQAVRAAVATLLLTNGLNLEQVPLATQTLVKQYGLPQLQDITHQSHDDKKQEQFRRMCNNADIQLPDDKRTKIKHAKHQQQSHDRAHNSTRNIDVTRYQLQQGFFLLSDKSASPIHATFSPHKPGATMLSPKDAQTWIQQPMSLSPDEVAILVVGDADFSKIPSAQAAVAPAFNSTGNRVLIGGTLIQLGEKAISTVGDASDDKLELRETQICSITMWQQDYSPTEWQACCSSPVRFSKQILAQDHMDHAIRNPFGRAFRNGKQPCAPAEATSVQYHTEIWIQDLKQILRLSGWSRLFITPKEHDGRPSSFWKPIWIEAPKSTLEAKTASLAGMAGYIRGNRMSGVRVEASNFHACWSVLRPDQPVPTVQPAKHVWKVQPFPWGMDKAIIQEWLDKISWTAHPMKPIGARAWLIASDTAPPPGIIHSSSSKRRKADPKIPRSDY